MPVSLRAPDDFKKMPWRNGQGETIELARQDADTPAGFFWRISRASVSTPGPFSQFPGVDRELMLLSGAGLTLDLADDGQRTINQLYQSIRFPGDVPAICNLIDGPCEDLNIMVARGLGSAVVKRHDMHARMTAAHTTILYALDGDWSLNLVDAGYPLCTGCMAILTDEPGAVFLTGSGMLVQVDIQ
jgi:environmental stress-induced protein Ves